MLVTFSSPAVVTDFNCFAPSDVTACVASDLAVEISEIACVAAVLTLSDAFSAASFAEEALLAKEDAEFAAEVAALAADAASSAEPFAA